MKDLKVINIGAQADDGTGDYARDSFAKVNDNTRDMKSAIDAVEVLAASNGQAVVRAQQTADAAAATAQAASTLAGGAQQVGQAAQQTADSANATATRAESTANGAVQAISALERSVADTYLTKAKVGAANGAAPLGPDAKVPYVNLPSFDSVPVGFVAWCPDRANVWLGWLAADGQAISRATYPDLGKMVTEGKTKVIPEADWVADPLKRGAYTAGDGSTTIRVPDYNGKSAGSLGRVFLSGDGVNSAGTSGIIQRDAQQRVTGSVSSLYRAGDSGASGSMTRTQASSVPAQVGTTGASPGDAVLIGLDSALQVRTATENRPQNVTGCFVIKAYGVTVDTAGVNLSGLVNDVQANQQRIEQVNTEVNAKINPALSSAGRLDLSSNPVISGPLTGTHAAASVRFKTSLSGADGSTYVAAVPGAGGSLAGFIARSAEQFDSAFVTLTCSPTAANVTFSRHGSATAPQMLTITSASTECGRIDQYGNWTFGTRPAALAASTKAVLHFEGGNRQWGLLFAPDVNDGAALAFQNSGGGLVGSITTSATSTAFNTASDYRLKKDVFAMPPSEALLSIRALSPKTYVWRQTGEIGEGFIAHELQAEIPGAVYGEKDDPSGMQSVNYAYLVPRMVAAIQGAAERIDALEGALAALAARLSRLEASTSAGGEAE